MNAQENSHPGNPRVWCWLALAILLEFLDEFPAMQSSAHPDKLGRISEAGTINRLLGGVSSAALLLGLFTVLMLMRRPRNKSIWSVSILLIFTSHAISLWAHILYSGDYMEGIRSFASSGFIQKALSR